MGIMEIILLLFGCAIFVGSFLIPAEKKKQGEKEPFQEETVRKIIDEEIKEAKSQISDIVDETITYAMEKTERSMERLTNEKIMAVSEYSDTVLQEIHKNHEEAMFLYDMLNNKHANIKDTVSKMDKAVKAAEDKAKVKAEENVKTQKENVTEEQLIEVQEPAETIEPSGSPEIGFMGETAEEGQNNNEKILEMHRQGKSTVAIAKELGLGVGEVKLVIDLYKA